ncbi:MAG: hypothetical protein FD167_4802 [bacterium]|nr:MAG: hypothetical protein FD167_4802 [bacterium]
MSEPSFFSNYKAQPRGRRLDRFASPQKIVQLLEKLLNKIKPELTNYISLDNIEKNNYEMLVHILQRGANYLRSGGKSKSNSKSDKIPNNLLLQIVNTMSEILAKESHNRISFRTFTDNYLRILSCSNDIKDWLEVGEITLFEALQLKRLNAESLAVSLDQASVVRANFFFECRKEKWIIQRLRYEIDLKLGKTGSIEKPIKTFSSLVEETPSLSLDREVFINPNSFFSEQSYSMIEMINSINFEELEKSEQEVLLNSIDNVILQLQKIVKKRQKIITQIKIENPNLGFL